MSYVRKILAGDETLIAIFRPHWIYFVEGVLWFFVLTAIGFALDFYLYLYFGMNAIHFKVDMWFMEFDEKNTPIIWIFMFCGFAVFWPLFLAYVATEIGLTSKRIVYKKGLILIQVDEVDLEDIRAEHVFHGFFGWLLGYGRIRLDCRFIEDVWLPAIYNPYRLVKASHTARMKSPSIPYGQDEFQANMDRINQSRKDAAFSAKVVRLKDAVKRNFKKAS